MTFDTGIYSINYTIETVNSTVYLIGIAQNKTEHDRAKEHAAKIKFVQNVISHVRIKNKIILSTNSLGVSVSYIVSVN